MAASLLRYDNPVLVSRNDEKKTVKSKKFTANKTLEGSTDGGNVKFLTYIILKLNKFSTT